MIDRIKNWLWHESRAEDDMLSALVWMAAQYLEDKDEKLDHMFMCAGEMTFDVLRDHGLITDDGRFAEWTDKGRAFLASH